LALFRELRLGAAAICQGHVGTFDPVEWRAPERRDENLVGRRVKLRPADGADADPVNRGYFFAWPWFFG
jgi:hypothetical protein